MEHQTPEGGWLMLVVLVSGNSTLPELLVNHVEKSGSVRCVVFWARGWFESVSAIYHVQERMLSKTLP